MIQLKVPRGFNRGVFVTVQTLASLLRVLLVIINVPIFFIQIYFRTRSATLSLIFTTVRIQDILIHLCKNQLSDSASGPQLDCTAIGVKQLNAAWCACDRQEVSCHTHYRIIY